MSNYPMGAEFDSSAPYNEESMDIDCSACEDTERLSNCCGAEFTFPGWPDSDICSAKDCYEHAGYHCEICNGEGYITLTGTDLKEYLLNQKDAMYD